ncbi:hypothetical protein C0416_04185 [bacterium]|nr:hypothetical protein [bacterium]
MHIMKIFIQFIFSLTCSVIFGLIGFTNGANFGGNYGFPRFGGGVGWESGGMFFMIMGIALGSFIGITLARKLQKEKLKFKIASITTLIIICIQIAVFYNGVPQFALFGIVMLLIPSVALVAITNLKKFP